MTNLTPIDPVNDYLHQGAAGDTILVTHLAPGTSPEQQNSVFTAQSTNTYSETPNQSIVNKSRFPLQTPSSEDQTPSSEDQTPNTYSEEQTPESIEQDITPQNARISKNIPFNFQYLEPPVITPSSKTITPQYQSTSSAQQITPASKAITPTPQITQQQTSQVASKQSIVNPQYSTGSISNVSNISIQPYAPQIPIVQYQQTPIPQFISPSPQSVNIPIIEEEITNKTAAESRIRGSARQSTQLPPQNIQNTNDQQQRRKTVQSKITKSTTSQSGLGIQRIRYNESEERSSDNLREGNESVSGDDHRQSIIQQQEGRANSDNEINQLNIQREKEDRMDVITAPIQIAKKKKKGRRKRTDNALSDDEDNRPVRKRNTGQINGSAAFNVFKSITPMKIANNAKDIIQEALTVFLQEMGTELTEEDDITGLKKNTTISHIDIIRYLHKHKLLTDERILPMKPDAELDYEDLYMNEVRKMLPKELWK
ncbi:MAG: hypothetical protein EZS28_000995 [Streblomastix strix]|uniref:Uncharacterized protein n=1 Tax=Streblomastix strix TaxID=222440 RepID=A0A5J4XAF0_9EUKA|nr:MAG: hypothetical protein EZS28_000995 [Streblomastix strix]